MKNSIVVGPIKKAAKKPVNSAYADVQNRLSNLKIGMFFEISGLGKGSKSKDVKSMRAAISYISKKKNIKTSTSLNKGILVVERVSITPNRPSVAKAKPAVSTPVLSEVKSVVSKPATKSKTSSYKSVAKVKTTVSKPVSTKAKPTVGKTKEVPTV